MGATAGGRNGDWPRQLGGAVGTLLVLALPSCASGDASTPAISTVTTVVTKGPSSQPTTSSPSSSGSDLTSSPGTTLAAPRSGEPLRLEDFFQPGSAWQANRYDIAGKSDVQGIATTVNSCSEGGASVLELRLSNKFTTLTFSVAQADNSQSSDQKLTVEVLNNNEQAEIRAVPFNEVQGF